MGHMRQACLLHMYLTEEGLPETVRQRGSNGEDSSEKVCRRRFAGEGPSEKVYRRRSVREDLSEKIRRRRPIGEGSTEKVHRRRFVEEDGCRKRGFTPEPTMALIPCEMREEQNTFLY